MSSFTSSSKDQQGYDIVPVLANLGAFPGMSTSLHNAVHNVTSTLPYPLQRMDAGMPHQYYQFLAHIPSTFNNHNINNLPYFDQTSPVMLPSKEVAPSVAIPDFYNTLYPDVATDNMIPVPLWQPLATQHVAPTIYAQDGNWLSAQHQGHGVVVNTTTTTGPSRTPTQRHQITKPYTRRATSTSSTSSEPTHSESGQCLSAVAISRLAIQGTCKFKKCGEIFACVSVYKSHIYDVHEMKRAKRGKEKGDCPMEGCGDRKSEASLSNHLLGHNVRIGCLVCDSVLKGARSDQLQKHYQRNHKETHGKVSIPSDQLLNFGYLFFEEA